MPFSRLGKAKQKSHQMESLSDETLKCVLAPLGHHCFDFYRKSGTDVFVSVLDFSV